MWAYMAGLPSSRWLVKSQKERTQSDYICPFRSRVTYRENGDTDSRVSELLEARLGDL